LSFWLLPISCFTCFHHDRTSIYQQTLWGLHWISTQLPIVLISLIVITMSTVAQTTGIKNQFYALIKAHEQSFSMVYLTIRIDYKNCPRHVFCGPKRVGYQSASCNLVICRNGEIYNRKGVRMGFCMLLRLIAYSKAKTLVHIASEI